MRKHLVSFSVSLVTSFILCTAYQIAGKSSENPNWLPLHATDHVSLGGQWHTFKVNVDGKSHTILAFKTLNTEVIFTELREP